MLSLPLRKFCERNHIHYEELEDRYSFYNYRMNESFELSKTSVDLFPNLTKVKIETHFKRKMIY